MQGKDDLLARFEENVFVAIEKLAADHDVMSGESDVFVTSGQIRPGASFVVWRGPAGCSLWLPQVAALGANVGQLISMVNPSGAPVNVFAAAGDSIMGSTGRTLASLDLCLLQGDGQHMWFSNQ